MLLLWPAQALGSISLPPNAAAGGVWSDGAFTGPDLHTPDWSSKTGSIEASRCAALPEGETAPTPTDSPLAIPIHWSESIHLSESIHWSNRDQYVPCTSLTPLTPAAAGPLTGATGGPVATPTYDVPVVMNDKVERFIDYFQTRGRKHFVKWLERSTTYIPMMTEMLADGGLPEDLVYLSMIESGFNPRAKSRARAVGIWQFMRWTGKKYGLRVDWWIDERRDPEKATRAAIDYLGVLYDRFGSWYLAAASYNAGEGRTSRAIKRYKTDDFWTLASKKKAYRRETRNYIPKFIAAIIIAKDPAKYGFTGLNYQDPVFYDTVEVADATDLRVIAKAAGVSVKELRRLNPELKRWFTPPKYPGYTLKVPEGTSAAFNENIKKVPTQERLKFHTHRVRKGESLWSLSRLYKTPIRQIMYLNNLRSSRFIRAGKTLVIPTRPSRAGAYRSSAYKRGVSSTIAASGAYIIRRGDTLWDISKRYDVKLENILKWNNLNKRDTLFPGQRIFLKEARLSDDATG